MACLSEAFNTFEVKVVDKQYPTGVCDCGQNLNNQKNYKVCDNGCDTTFCNSCNVQYHCNNNNVWVKGHSKKCGHSFRPRSK